MAVNSYDPTTGRPIFADTDAPDIKVDPGEAAAYAEEVGNRIVGTTEYLAAYPYQREGLEGYDTTLNREVIHNGSGWVVVWRDTGWVEVTSFATGWTALEDVAWRVIGNTLHLVGRVNGDASSGALIFNIPAPYRHTRAQTVQFAEGSRTLTFTPGGNIQCEVPAAGVRSGVILSAISAFVG